MNNGPSQPIIVYYNFRGKAQPIRHLLRYLNIEYTPVDFEHYSHHQNEYSQNIREVLSNHTIEKKNLPQFFHEGIILNEIYPILAYICRRFQVPQMFGKDIYDQSRLQQIMTHIIQKQPQNMAEMFQLAEQTLRCNQAELDIQKRKSYERMLKGSGYAREICEFLRQKNQCGFVFGYMTVLDFMFYETCFYMLGIFGTIDEKANCPINWLLKNVFSCQEGLNLQYLNVMRKFKNHFEQQDFYLKNKNFFQSFPVHCPIIVSEKAKLLKRIWVGDPKFFSSIP